jgi:dimethylargininase
LAIKQQEGYMAALQESGVKLTVLPEEPDLPDAAFVEDTVLMLDELAVLCRLGCRSREPEADIMAPIVSQLRPVVRITPPGTLEGGDVLRIAKNLFVGLSTRTNREGIRQLEEIVRRKWIRFGRFSHKPTRWLRPPLGLESLLKLCL